MVHTTHSARVMGPIPYAKGDGKTATIPLGPCLIEQIDDQSFDIVWGGRGQSSTALRAEDIQAAAAGGHLLLLD